MGEDKGSQTEADDLNSRSQADRGGAASTVGKGETRGLAGGPFHLTCSDGTRRKGVAPAGFTGIVIGNEPDMWVPLATTSQITHDADLMKGFNSDWLFGIGRLRPGLSPEQARANLVVVSHSLQKAYSAEHTDPPTTTWQLSSALPPILTSRLFPAAASARLWLGCVTRCSASGRCFRGMISWCPWCPCTTRKPC